MNKRIDCLDDGFVQLIDHMGDDQAIVQAARVSYGQDVRNPNKEAAAKITGLKEGLIKYIRFSDSGKVQVKLQDESVHDISQEEWLLHKIEQKEKDRNLIRYLMRKRHTSPFEMVEFKFLIRIPMDAWRQMVRHRTANINEYSTRYKPAIDSQQKTSPGSWRLQATDNKQGSHGYLDEWPEETHITLDSLQGLNYKPGEALTKKELDYHVAAKELYKARLALGVAREQARKDLPLSTYTEAYWKIDLHNLFHFLQLRLDSHAQQEIREYAAALYQLIKPIVPVACKAFEDYRTEAVTFSAQEMQLIQIAVLNASLLQDIEDGAITQTAMTDREWKEFKEKIGG